MTSTRPSNQAGPGPGSGRAWHATEIDEVEALLATSPEGLGAAEVAARLAEHGPNVIPEEPPPAGIVIFARQFTSPLIWILVVATFVTLALGEWLDAILITIALLLNAVIGFVQERRASDAVRALMQLVVPRCHVVRDGREQEIPSPDLVPGDLVVLDPGSRLPADLRLSATQELRIDESLLTGESLPVTKQDSVVDAAAVTADRSSMAYTGAMVTSGRGRGYVVATGLDTELGAIAGQIRVNDATATPLQQRMQSFATIIGVSVLVAAVVAFVSGVAMGESVATMFHTAVALAVSAVPEALPVATTVTLAIGVSRMARRNAVLRRLPALETLGSTTVIGSDKTGTLTENRMTVESIWAGGEWFDLLGDPPDLNRLGAAGEALRLTLSAGVLTNEATLIVEPDQTTTTTGDPTEVAMLVAAASVGLDPTTLRDRHPVVSEIPFEPERRYSAGTRIVDDEAMVWVKGAPEQVSAMCSTMLTPAGPVAIDADVVRTVEAELAARGLRVLAMAVRRLEPDEDPPGGRTDPHDLMLVGMQAMVDPPRAGVRDAIDSCRDAGLRVIMITGDHVMTARAIGARLGLTESADAPACTGAELAEISDEALRRLVSEVSVFARVSPNDKLRIVRALQSEGHTVAVTGDGVNDAPALRAAALGIAMGRDGTDVAREASDMVLSDDNFVSIVAAVEEGRIAFANIRKISFFLVSTAVAETFAIMMSVWLGWPLLLVPAQILWLNLVTNGVQDLALAFEPGSPGVLKRPPRPRREGILSAMMWERTVLVGVVMAAGTLAMFRWQLDRDGSLIAAQSVALTTLVVFNVFQAGNARAENRSVFSLSPLSNPFLFWATLGAMALHIAALYLPPTQYVLSIEPIDGATWIRAVVVASSVLVAVELHKAFRRRHPRTPRARAVGVGSTA